MSVAVITPFFDKPASWLQQCLTSVTRQTVPCTHFLVCDGDTPGGVEMGRHVQLLRLPKPHEDFGNAARAIGSVSAISQGFDALAYLDADNWYEPEHLQKLLVAQSQTQAAICTSGRNLVDLEGRLLGACLEVDGKTFVDTSCFMLTKAAYGLVPVWFLMPRSQAAYSDRVFWKAVLDSKLKHMHVPEPTVAYRTNYEVHYRFFGKEPPLGAKPNVPISKQAVVPAQRFDVSPAPVRTSPSTRVQSISLCMIVKNEEQNIEDCLKSVKGLVKEIIVVDTGSTDRTLELALKHGARVVDFAWVDNFSAARNEALKYATGEWIFWMDADDRLDPENRARFQRLKDQLPEGNYAYMMKQWSIPDSPQCSPLAVDHVRLFRKQPGVGWRYRLHEQILPSLKETKAKIVVTDLVIHHLGYQDPALRKRKLQRNLDILHKEYEEQPEDAFVLFNLAGTYLDFGDQEKAIPFLHGCVQRSPRGASFLPKAYALLAQAHRQAGRLEEAQKTCQEGRGVFPRNAELCFEDGLIHHFRKDPAAAVTAFETVLTLPRGPQFVGTDEGIFNHLARHHLALALRALKRLGEAEQQWRLAIDKAPSFPPSWIGLCELLIDQKRFQEAEALAVEAKALSKGSVTATVVAARLLLAQDKKALACEMLEKALESEPSNTWLRLFLCDVRIRRGLDLDRAETHLRHILASEPRHRQAQEKLQSLIARRTSTPSLP